MKCHHCGGIMFYEKVSNQEGHFEIWRCVLCGEYVDRVILENRQFQKTIRENGRKRRESHAEDRDSPPPFLQRQEILN